MNDYSQKARYVFLPSIVFSFFCIGSSGRAVGTVGMRTIAFPPLDFLHVTYLFSSRGGGSKLCPPNYYSSPGFSNLHTALLLTLWSRQFWSSYSSSLRSSHSRSLNILCGNWLWRSILNSLNSYYTIELKSKKFYQMRLFRRKENQQKRHIMIILILVATKLVARSGDMHLKRRARHKVDCSLQIDFNP